MACCWESCFGARDETAAWCGNVDPLILDFPHRGFRYHFSNRWVAMMKTGSRKDSRGKKIVAIAWMGLMVSMLSVSIMDMITPCTVTCFREQQLIKEARERILEVRRGTSVLDFGPGNASKMVYLRQVSHDFKFGCNAFFYNRIYNDDWSYNETLNQEYSTHFSKMFNYATLPFYMKVYNEFNPDLENWQQTLENMTDWVKSFNATPKGHPLIWQIPNQVPDQVEYHPNASYREEWTLQHLGTVLLNHTGIDTWDLLNEMTHVKNLLLGDTAVETWEKALDKARAVRPDATFIANEYETIQPGDAATSGTDATSFYEFVETVVAHGYAPDVLGFQGHEWISGWIPLQDVIDTFDSFGRFKIPCQVSE
ncbi:hypothetical protein GF325_07835, partial [Candidatus Bathyarchaeota archaeon]|nr:hypothetical protein [Candidatus Bathyarchaeota archaeon]